MLKLLTKLRKSIFPKWEDIERYDESWKSRTQTMASFIPKEVSSIMDLGAGKLWLREFISNEIEYTPVDRVLQSSDTIICDFNKKEFPQLSSDLAFCSGLLEYVEDLPWFFNQIRKSNSYLLVSYCATEEYPSILNRKRNGWVNHLSLDTLTKMIMETGFDLIQDKKDKNSILLFKNNESIHH